NLRDPSIRVSAAAVAAGTPTPATSLNLSGRPKRSPALRVLDGGPITKQLHRGEVVGLGPEQLVQLLGQLVAVGVGTPPTEEAVIGLPKLAERRNPRVGERSQLRHQSHRNPLDGICRLANEFLLACARLVNDRSR